MKKFILTTVAAGALAFGGAASAQDPLGVLGQILGNIGLGGTTAVIPGVVGQTQVHVDQYGRRFYYDQYGRAVLLDQGSNVYGNHPIYDVYGSTIFGGHPQGRTVYDTYGRTVVLDHLGTYTDAYGVRMHVDASGRHHRLGQYGSYRDQYGRTVYLGSDRRPLFVEQNGQLYSAAATSTASVNPRDRDGDGVRNRDDRYPDDPRYR